MAARKAGMRRTVVDGVEYVWKFPRRRDHHDRDARGGCAALVQRAGRRGYVLFVSFPQHHPGVAAPVGWPGVPALPSQIAAAVRRAVAAGWRADEPGPASEVAGE
ncbi:MAG: hypothetical protein ACRC33_03020 [Gemmataceae bacterium]